MTILFKYFLLLCCVSLHLVVHILFGLIKYLLFLRKLLSRNTHSLRFRVLLSIGLSLWIKEFRSLCRSAFFMAKLIALLLNFMKSFNLGPIVLLTLATMASNGVSNGVSNGTSAYATDLPIDPPTLNDDSLDQVTSVSQLTDVKPTDWAFQSLQSLVERYGCISGFPDKTYRGDRALSRYEFAAGLNACIDRVNDLIAANRNGANREDLNTLRKLQEQFASELATLRGKVDGLDSKIATLEKQQFSTTSKLYGQIVVGLQGSNNIGIDLFPKDGIKERSGQANLNFGYNAQITIATSFRGDDLLLTGLQTGNISSSAGLLSTNMGRLAYESELNNQLVISDLSYRFPITKSFGVIIGAAGVNPENVFRGINPLEGYADGAFSRFGQRNPILTVADTSAGLGFDWQITPKVSLQGVYSATNPSLTSDAEIGGLFNGSYTAGAQLSLAPTKSIDVGLHYLYSRSPNGVLGFGVGDTQLISPLVADSVATTTQAIGATAAWRINPKWTIGAWGGWTSSNAIGQPGTVETTNWMMFSALPDLFVPGNLGGLLLGQPPKITSSTLPDGLNFPNFSNNGTPGAQSASALHIEAFYRAKVSDHITITPGFLMIFNPNHNASNDTLMIGTVRASFQF